MSASMSAPASILPTGIPVVDRFLANGYTAVPGFSSRFAASICGHILRRQYELGIHGSIAEIGTFEGRFFIAMGLALQANEHAYGFDLFDWPGSDLRAKLLGHAKAHGLAADRFTPVSLHTGKLTAADFAKATGGKPLRFIHVDGDHTPEALTQDLALAHANLHPKGIICIDDMLHPAFPFLVVTVHAYLAKHPEMRLLAVLDRQDIFGAPKFLLCRADAVSLYDTDLMTTFKAQHLTIGGDAMGRICVVLTPDPRLNSPPW
jgi:predicted O-methyltransferase YrrM